MAAAGPPPMRFVLCMSALAAVVVSNVHAVRVDGAVNARSESLAALAAWKSAAPAELDSVTRAQRDKDMETATVFVGSVDPTDIGLHLGEIYDIFERFEDIRERLIGFGAARDARRREKIRGVLRDIREKSDALRRMAADKEEAGEVDDGGDELPSQRENICTGIGHTGANTDFVELVQLFCSSLDAVRRAVNSGEREDALAFAVSGLVSSMSMKPEYRLTHIGWGIECLLGEERRWVTKQLAQRSVPPGRENAHLWAFRAWKTRLMTDPDVDFATLPAMALKAAIAVAADSTVEQHRNSSLGFLRTRIQRLEFSRVRLAQFIVRTDPAFRNQIRDALDLMKEKAEALTRLAKEKEDAGEIDDSGDMLPSKRDNICQNLGGIGLEPDFIDEVNMLCEAFDRLHLTAIDGGDRTTGMFEVLGRIAAIKRRTGYRDCAVSTDLEILLADEWSWLDNYVARNARASSSK